jgi:hypothetical protein
MSLAETIRQQQRDALCKMLCERGWCSWPWAEACVSWNAVDGKWDLLPGVFPPGGAETLMQECPICKRVCPPNGADGSSCCDCQTEKEERDFLKWAIHGQNRELLPNLGRLWWRSAISYADFMERPTAGLLGGSCLEQSAEGMTGAAEGNAFYADADGPTTSDERGRTNNVTDPRLALQIALRRLNPRKKEGRCPGCQILLLPESENVLQEEIAYFETNGRVRPSARRYSRHYPYLPAPEDYDLPAAYAEDAEDVDPDSQAIDAQAACTW